MNQIKAVRGGILGTNMAAITFSVPPSTLKDRISGRVKNGTKSDPVHMEKLWKGIHIKKY